MGYYERLGEQMDPGSVGSIELGPRQRDASTDLGSLVVRVALSAAMVGGAWFWGLSRVRTIDLKAIATAALITVVALLVAYVVRPRADHSNIGWLGGLVDNPLRFSDDINRVLMVLNIAMWPARFAAETVVDVIAFFESEPDGVLPPRVGTRSEELRDRVRAARRP